MMSNADTEAEKAFYKKLHWATGDRDWNQVSNIFLKYGAYLDLIDVPGPPEPYSYEYQWTKLPPKVNLIKTKELVFVGHGEPTLEEEQEHVLNGGHARFVVEVLKMDPSSLTKIIHHTQDDTQDFPAIPF